MRGVFLAVSWADSVKFYNELSNFRLNYQLKVRSNLSVASKTELKNLRGKIDAVLRAVNSLTGRIDSIEKKIGMFEATLKELHDKYDAECANRNAFRTKVLIEVHQKLHKQVEKLTNQIDTMKKETSMQDCYNKQLNLLVHGTKKTPWETREKTKEIFNQFIRESFRLNPYYFCVIDLHRLPQTPFNKNGVRSTRPIIVKLCSVFEKHVIMSSLRNLKEYNQTVNSEASRFLTTGKKSLCHGTSTASFASTKKRSF